MSENLSIREIQCPHCENDRLKVAIRTYTNPETGKRRQWITAVCTNCDELIVVHRRVGEAETTGTVISLTPEQLEYFNSKRRPEESLSDTIDRIVAELFEEAEA